MYKCLHWRSMCGILHQRRLFACGATTLKNHSQLKQVPNSHIRNGNATIKIMKRLPLSSTLHAALLCFDLANVCQHEGHIPFRNKLKFLIPLQDVHKFVQLRIWIQPHIQQVDYVDISVFHLNAFLGQASAWCTETECFA